MAAHPRRVQGRGRPTRTVAPRRLQDRIFLTVLGLVVVLAALSTAGGTFAYWIDDAPADAGSITTGTAAVEAAWTTSADAAVFQNLLPGETGRRTLTVRNTGDVPLALTATATGAAPGLESHVQGSAGDTPVVLEAGAERTLTVEFRATTELTPGARSDLTITLDGKQIR